MATRIESQQCFGLHLMDRFNNEMDKLRKGSGFYGLDHPGYSELVSLIRVSSFGSKRAQAKTIHI